MMDPRTKIDTDTTMMIDTTRLDAYKPDLGLVVLMWIGSLLLVVVWALMTGAL